MSGPFTPEQEARIREVVCAEIRVALDCAASGTAEAMFKYIDASKVSADFAPPLHGVRGSAESAGWRPTNAMLANGVDDLRSRLPGMWNAYYPETTARAPSLAFFLAELAKVAAVLRRTPEC